MTPDIVYCFVDQNIEDAVQTMERYQIRRLPVLSREKRLVGMVSLGALAVSSSNETRVGETLKRVSEPAEPRR
jgi:CBS-domain-containing membrane protein